MVVANIAGISTAIEGVESVISRIRRNHNNVRNTKVRVVFRGDIVKDDSGSFAVLDATHQDAAERIVSLPGGLAPAAYWASWADAMPMLSRRLLELTTHIVDEMARGPQGGDPLSSTLVLERLRLPWDVTESKCEWGCFLDTTGRHRACLPEIWQTPHKSSRSRKDFVQSVQGSRSHSSHQQQAPGMNVRCRLKCSSADCQAPRSATGSRHHRCPNAARRRGAAQSGSGSRRPMEHGVC